MTLNVAAHTILFMRTYLGDQITDTQDPRYQVPLSHAARERLSTLSDDDLVRYVIGICKRKFHGLPKRRRETYRECVVSPELVTPLGDALDAFNRPLAAAIDASLGLLPRKEYADATHIPISIDPDDYATIKDIAESRCLRLSDLICEGLLDIPPITERPKGVGTLSISVPGNLASELDHQAQKTGRYKIDLARDALYQGAIRASELHRGSRFREGRNRIYLETPRNRALSWIALQRRTTREDLLDTYFRDIPATPPPSIGRKNATILNLDAAQSRVFNAATQETLLTAGQCVSFVIDRLLSDFLQCPVPSSAEALEKAYVALEREIPRKAPLGPGRHAWRRIA